MREDVDRDYEDVRRDFVVADRGFEDVRRDFVVADRGFEDVHRDFVDVHRDFVVAERDFNEARPRISVVWARRWFVRVAKAQDAALVRSLLTSRFLRFAERTFS